MGATRLPLSNEDLVRHNPATVMGDEQPPSGRVTFLADWLSEMTLSSYPTCGCLSYTTVLVNAFPFASRPLTTCVIVIPSAEIVMVLGISDALPSTMK